MDLLKFYASNPVIPTP